MAEGLFPVVGVTETVNAKEQYDQQYKPSYRWDFGKGDFVRDGANKILTCSGVEAYKTWCMKAVNTERKTCIAYTNEIGAEMVSAFRKPSRKTQESAIERTIRETLMTNPRTEYVRNFSFAWSGDSVMVRFTVKGIDYDSFQLEL